MDMLFLRMSHHCYCCLWHFEWKCDFGDIVSSERDPSTCWIEKKMMIMTMKTQVVSISKCQCKEIWGLEGLSAACATLPVRCFTSSVECDVNFFLLWFCWLTLPLTALWPRGQGSQPGQAGRVSRSPVFLGMGWEVRGPWTGCAHPPNTTEGYRVESTLH